MSTDSTVAERPSFESWKQTLSARAPLLFFVLLVGVALFARSLYSLGADQILAGLLRVGWGFAAIVVVAGAREALRALAWMRAIDGSARLGFAEAFRARLVGEAFSSLLPMGILVGEPAKAVQVRRIVPLPTALAGLALEFFFYSLSLLVLLTTGAIALMLISSNEQYGHWLYISAPTGMFVLAVAASLLLRRPLLHVPTASARRAGRSGPADALAQVKASGLRTLVATKAQGVLQRVRTFVASRRVSQLVGIFGLELGFQVLAVVEVYITLLLISPVPPTVASAVVLEAVGRLVTMAFKYLPMRIGVDEAGAAWFAGILQLGSHTGVTLAVVRKLRLLFWSAVGLALLGRERSTKWLPA
jgi:hypothetical protein